MIRFYQAEVENTEPRGGHREPVVITRMHTAMFVAAACVGSEESPDLDALRAELVSAGDRTLAQLCECWQELPEPLTARFDSAQQCNEALGGYRITDPIPEEYADSVDETCIRDGYEMDPEGVAATYRCLIEGQHALRECLSTASCPVLNCIEAGFDSECEYPPEVVESLYDCLPVVFSANQ